MGATVFRDDGYEDSERQRLGVDGFLSADRMRTSSPTAYRSRSSSVAPANAFYMSMSAAHSETVNVAYAEAVFASGRKFGFCIDEEEWGTFWTKLMWTVWRPPSRNAMSSKYMDVVHNKVDASLQAVLRLLVGGCFQCDGWTDPNGAQVFSALYGATFPLFLSYFRLEGSLQTADVLVTKVKEQMARVGQARGDSWSNKPMTGIITDSPNFNRSARKKLLDADAFSFAYGCASHAMRNLCRDILKLPSAFKALTFYTALAKCFRTHYLPREHLRVQRLPSRFPRRL